MALIMMIGYANAQKPEAHSVTAEVQLNFQTGTAAISVSAPKLRGRYFIKNNLAGRLTLGYSYSNTTLNFAENEDGTGGTGKQDSTSSNFSIGIGIEKHFKGTERFSPYMGAEISSSAGTVGEISRSNTDGTSYVPNIIQNIIPGMTNTITFNLLIGADYYFINNVYLGIEAAWGYQHSTTAEGTKTTTTGSNNTVTVVTPETSSTGFGISTNAGLRLGFRF